MNRGVFREGGRWPREPIGYGRFYDVIDLEPRKTSRSCHFRPRGTGLINLSGQSFAQRREREREGGKDDEAHAQPPAFAKSLLSLSFRGPGCSIPRAAALTLAMIFGRAPPAPSSPPPMVIRGWVFPVPGRTMLRAFGKLPEQGTGETTARCRRRDINPTANNAADIAARDTPPRLRRFISCTERDGEIKRRRLRRDNDATKMR